LKLGHGLVALAPNNIAFGLFSHNLGRKNFKKTARSASHDGDETRILLASSAGRPQFTPTDTEESRGPTRLAGGLGWHLNHQGTPRVHHDRPRGINTLPPRRRKASDQILIPTSSPNHLVISRVAVPRDASGSSLDSDQRPRKVSVQFLAPTPIW
jgi:hypothetical protein